MENILIFDREFDINLFDDVVRTFYTSSGSTQREAEKVLTQFQESPDSWQRADQILQFSKESSSKFIGLSILDKLISTRWKLLPDEQRYNIRNFIVGMIMTFCKDGNLSVNDKKLIKKADMILVQILKQDWPVNYPDFIPELIDSSNYSEQLCGNNLEILRLLAEEIFEDSSQTMTSAKKNRLMESMTKEFEQIFRFCYDILQNSTSYDLINIALETLLCYVHWVPVNYIYDSNSLNVLSSKYLNDKKTRNISLKCLTEITQLDINANNIYYPALVDSLRKVLEIISVTIIPPNSHIEVVYDSVGTLDQIFLQDLVIYLTTFLFNYRDVLDENQSFCPFIIDAHEYLIKLTRINEREIFKIALDYWQSLVSELYHEIQRLPIYDLATAAGSGAVNPTFYKNFPLKKHRYDEICSQLRLVLVERMVKPEEVLVVENEEGELVRDFVEESETIQLYNTERSTLIYLVHLDVKNTEDILLDKLSKQVDGSEWSWNNLNTLCWAIGSISGTMTQGEERDFIVTVIRDLLNLDSNIEGTDNKIIMASNLIYVSGQYPRFLKIHWHFLKDIVNKLFEFMHEKNSGVQDMACDTFIKIVQKCKGSFIIPQPYQPDPLIESIISNITNTTCDLTPSQRVQFYKACAIIIAVQGNDLVRNELLSDLLEMVNITWKDTIEKYKNNPEILLDIDTIKMLVNILRTNVAVCSELNTYFYPQLIHINMDLLQLYQTVSDVVSQEIRTKGLVIIKSPLVRSFRSVKKEVLTLAETYVSEAANLENIIDNFILPLLTIVLRDYSNNVSGARDFEVLRCVSTITKKIGRNHPEISLIILNNTFKCTLDMINKDMSEYPEHRVQFYKLLYFIVSNSFEIFPNLPISEFTTFIDAIFWALKHSLVEVELLGLDISIKIVEYVDNLSDDILFKSNFYKACYCNYLSETFYILSSLEHKAGFPKQSVLLMNLIKLIKTSSISVSSNDNPRATLSNEEYVFNFLGRILTNHFPQLSPDQITLFLTALFKHYNDSTKFKGILRDFLVQIREYGGDPTDYLYVEDEDKTKNLKAVSADTYLIAGMRKPYEMDDVDI